MSSLDSAEMEREILSGKTYLKKAVSTQNNVNLYDMLANMLTEVLTERPANAPDFLSGYTNVSSKTKTKSDFNMDLHEKPVVPKMQIKLFKKPAHFENNDSSESDGNFEVPLPNCLHLAYIFEQAGIGIGREDMFRMFLAMKQLTRDYALVSIRFWGKLFGIDANYYVVECEFPLEEEEFVEDADPEGHESPEEIDYGVIDGPMEVDDYPKSTWKPPVPVPSEPHHSGANKKVYFVCNEIGEKWVKLPHVSPKEISVSRQITKLLTGRLDAPILSSPPFEGNESNYLRAIIARISAATHICPNGYFTFGDEEDDDDEDLKETFSINPEYVGLSLGELTDPAMMGWVHISQYLLPQGRCHWYDPNKHDNNIEDEEFEDEYDQDRPAISETGPRLLTTVSEDKGIQSNPSWSTRLSSKVLPRYAIAVARSNNWPGAFAFSMGKMYENLYVGWGRKYNSHCYTPARPTTTGDEYPYGPEVTEVDDPDVDAEKAMKAKELAAMRAADDLEENQPEDEDED